MKSLKKVRGSAKVRDAIYTISARGKLVVRYLTDAIERPLSRLESFENTQTATRLLTEIRSLLVKCVPIQNPGSYSVMRLLKSALNGKAIDTYSGQSLTFSDLILSRGCWPAGDLYRTGLVENKMLYVSWNPVPGLNESEDDEAVLMLCDIYENKIWLCIHRAGKRSDGFLVVNCTGAPAGKELNCWIAFKSADRTGEYSENEYAGWVRFSPQADDHDNE